MRLTKGGHVTGARLASHTAYKILRKHLAQAGVEDLRPHDFRRTLIGDLLQAKVDLYTVQQMAGHVSPLTTVRYDCCGDEARREAVEYLHFPYTRPPQRGKP